MKRIFAAILVVFALMSAGCKKGTLGTCPGDEGGQGRSLLNKSLLVGTWEETYWVQYDIVDGKPAGSYDTRAVAPGHYILTFNDDGTFKIVIDDDGDDLIYFGKYFYTDSDTPKLKFVYTDVEWELEYELVVVSKNGLTYRDERIPGTPSQDPWRPTRHMIWDYHFIRVAE